MNMHWYRSASLVAGKGEKGMRRSRWDFCLPMAIVSGALVVMYVLIEGGGTLPCCRSRIRP